NERYSSQELIIIQNLIEKFHKIFKELYKNKDVTYYLHDIFFHLLALCKKYGPSGQYSNQAFENAHKLSAMIREFLSSKDDGTPRARDINEEKDIRKWIKQYFHVKYVILLMRTNVPQMLYPPYFTK